MKLSALYAPKFWREKDLCARLGVTRTTLRRWREAGQFPNPTKIGANTNVWSPREIDVWMYERSKEKESAGES